jgi:tRNA (guanine37-N1)-methyltransferase
MCAAGESGSIGTSTTTEMRFDVVTLFPELFAPHLRQGVTRRAFEAAAGERPAVDVRLWPLRDFAADAYRRVDDRPYGGGAGMVMLVEPLLRAIDAIEADRGGPLPAVVHFTPSGNRIDHETVRRFAHGSGAVVLCARYEGVDQRLVDARVTHELSLGDFVLSGGELPALVLLDAVARVQEGVIAPESHELESFADGLLEGPHYSRPECVVIDGVTRAVPPVLLSGNHRALAAPAVARDHRHAPSGPDRGGARRGADRRRRRRVPARARPIITGFSILCRGRPRLPFL